SRLADLLDRGVAGGYPADIKMIYSVAGDLFNQVPNVRRIADAAQRLEFMVVHDNFMTPTARHADIVLPATTFWERNDVHTPWAGAGHYAIFMKQAIEPMGECRNDFDICSELARRLGISGYNDKTEDEWLRELTGGVIDDFDTFRERGLARLPAPDDAVAFARGIVDGQLVRVFNARGTTRLPARVTDRIAPGVVSIKEGAWFAPDASGADTRGCANVLTADRTSPAGAAPFNSCFVDVAPALP